MRGKANRLSYSSAGVDIKAGNRFVRALQPLARSTQNRAAAVQLGGFAAGLDVARLKMRDPLILATTDGVGTKLKLALDAKRCQDLGEDLVAMCVNDLVAEGATPLAFLDYFAVGRLDVRFGLALMRSVAKACRESGCALIGGETAEMPGLYAGGDFDLAGFAMGAVERRARLPRLGDIRAGDVLLGLASSGAHANGFALIRKIVAGKNLGARAPFDRRRTLAAALLAPTRLYVRPILRALAAGAPIKGLAHITGGGLLENLPRALPKDCAAEIDLQWRLPPLFQWLAQESGMTDTEMLGVFNCGIGMGVVVAEQDAAAVARVLSEPPSTSKQQGNTRRSPPQQGQTRRHAAASACGIIGRVAKRKQSRYLVKRRFG